MLGRLIQGYARGGQLESTTEETHTRNLLWPEFHLEGHYGSLSPPTTPLGSPTPRVSPFDDRVGLELNETKDLRLIIAQDAFGTNERPLLLYDSQAADPTASPADGSLPARSNASSPVSERASPAGSNVPVIGHMRNRSSTISGASASWSRPNKDNEPTDHLSNILDCMFGVSSATKSGSSTKMHLLPGDRSSTSDSNPRTSASTAFPPRAPLLRAKTATQSVNGQRQHATVKEDVETRDSVLITRMFSVTLPEAQEALRTHRRSSADQVDPASPLSPGREQQNGQATQNKRPKLIEKKTPVFAIGLLCYLPRPSDARPATATRPSSRASFNASSTPNSYGSDSFSSWTILNAIPEHLLSSDASRKLTDKGIDLIVKNWDVVIRSLTVVETYARPEVSQLLQEVNLAMISSAAKAPKGPSEQRTNQRNVYLRSPNALVQIAELRPLIRHTLWRVSYALRIPRVVTGFGLDTGGHWLDEARYLVRVCGSKQQNFFLFNLLTSFLGNHTEWLERMGPDWYRRQFKALNKGRPRPVSLVSRTVIICDSRSMARRIIFLLASFLPRSPGADLVAKYENDFLSPLSTPDISSSSPVGRILNEGSGRRHIHRKSRDAQSAYSRRELPAMSTSASSTDSIGGPARAPRRGPRSIRFRSDFDQGPSRQPSVFSPGEGPGGLHKTNATSTTITPNAGTPVPHFSRQNDSYFPEGAIVDGEESGASADLARILRRDSISQPQGGQSGINWGSLISNVSGLWSKKHDSPASTDQLAFAPATGSLRERRNFPRSVPIHGRRPSQLERMAAEAGDVRQLLLEGKYAEAVAPPRRPSMTTSEAPTPRLKVDERDGVVDVDIDLPGFLGSNTPTSSLHHRSPSLASMDEAGSSFSTRSLGNNVVGPQSKNVAGYLKRYHEDFLLQGVKPYPELQDDVKQSMLREETCIDERCLEELKDGELWINVCSTLLADFRNFTIQRLTLQRRADSASSGGMAFSPRAVSESVNTPTKGGASSPPKGSATPPDETERFVTETVMDFDATLTDAIEGVLREVEHPRSNWAATPMTHSRTASAGTASSVRSEPLDISSPRRLKAPGAMLSQSDCRMAVVGALEEVVRSVNQDLARHHRDRDPDGHLKLDGKTLEQEMKQENVLRAGVKRWLLNVETRNVW